MTESDRAPSRSETIVSLEELGPRGAERSFDFDEAARTELAETLRTPAVNVVKATLRIQPSKEGARVRGSIAAQLERICVASLEPMVEELAIDVDVRFSRNTSEIAAGADEKAALSVDDLEVEQLQTDTIDLWAIVADEIALAMAAYPRRAGADDLLDEFGSEPDASPFAVLKPHFPSSDDEK